ncbi:MAG: polysaccharide deacetylase [Clostridia bacterium]
MKIKKILLAISCICIAISAVACTANEDVKKSQGESQVEEKIDEEIEKEKEIEKEIEEKQDTESPIIIFNGEANITLTKGTEYIEPGVILKDNVESAEYLNEHLIVETDLNVEKAGQYKVIYKVADSSSNAASAARNITVVGAEEKISASTVYLTFDDGPGKYTEKLLDVLKANNVKATFFIKNADSKYDYLIQRMQAEGHTIALHTYSHDYATIYASKDAYLNDLNSISDKVYTLTGIRSKIFRFPGGSSNQVSAKYCSGVVTDIAKTLKNDGYSYFDWNVDSKDASGQVLTSSQIADNVISSLGNNSSYVVLQHDIKESSVNAVEDIIKRAKEAGYTFSNITEDTEEIHHNIYN